METPESVNTITIFAQTNFRGQRWRFGIKRAHRPAHVYIIGKTGTGKSTLIANLARQDAVHGEGFAPFDLHGHLVTQALRHVPEESQRHFIAPLARRIFSNALFSQPKKVRRTRNRSGCVAVT